MLPRSGVALVVYLGSILCAGLFPAIRSQTTEANDSKQDDYVRLVERGIEDALAYVYPRDASSYAVDWRQCWLKPLSCFQPIVHGTYDFIVIGSGSAGSVVANRLTEVETFGVLLLEAGRFENKFVDIPAMAFYAQGTEYNWAFVSEPQRNCCLGMVEQRCQFQRGRGIGGTTIINGLVYSRGAAADYNRWSDMGNPGWSYEEVLPYFMKSENQTIESADSGYHGTSGYLNVEYSSYRTPHLDAFLDGNAELGYKQLDYNGREQLGYSKAQFNTNHGKRQTAGAAFIRRAIRRSNLVVSPKSYVTRILINPFTKRAYGVEFTKNNRVYVAYASKEVILSAGSISSPHILMHSGVGLRQVLQNAFLPVIHELPVGENLQDHISIFGLSITSNTTLKEVSIEENVKEYLQGEGLYTLPGNNYAVGFYKTNFSKYDDESADLELILIAAPRTDEYFQKGYAFTQETYEALTADLDNTNTFSVYVYTMHPDSVGTVRVKSNNPFDYPVIDPKFLEDPEGYDLETLYAGVKLVERLLNTTAMQKLNAQFKPVRLPRCSQHELFSRGYWLCFIKHTSDEIYHPVGTCKMGPDPKNAVVNNKGQVHGIDNLRVADASIIPFSLAGHTSAPSMMVGERISDFIKETYNISTTTNKSTRV